MVVERRDMFYLTADAVVFTILDRKLKVLLVRRGSEPFKGRFALPGGFVNLDEDLEAAAARELKEETGVRDIYLRQLPSFGAVGRDPRGRIVTAPFLALIDGERVMLHASGDADLAKWRDAYDLPPLAFDHRRIFDAALKALRAEIGRTNLATEIMPERFTLSELQNAHETILGRKLDKRNFRKKIKELGVLREEDETKMEGAHRPAQLYSFRTKAYKAD
jgi:8-oxo-dGTP diphosphatase